MATCIFYAYNAPAGITPESDFARMIRNETHGEAVITNVSYTQGNEAILTMKESGHCAKWFIA